MVDMDAKKIADVQDVVNAFGGDTAEEGILSLLLMFLGADKELNFDSLLVNAFHYGLLIAAHDPRMAGQLLEYIATTFASNSNINALYIMQTNVKELGALYRAFAGEGDIVALLQEAGIES